MMKTPKAVICGLMKKDGKILFLEKEGKIEMPWIYGSLAGDPINAIGEAFRKKTGIGVEVGGIVLEGRLEIEGKHMPVLVLEMEAMGEGYVVFPADDFKVVWLDLEEAKKKNLRQHAQWLKNEIIKV